MLSLPRKDRAAVKLKSRKQETKQGTYQVFCSGYLRDNTKFYLNLQPSPSDIFFQECLLTTKLGIKQLIADNMI